MEEINKIPKNKNLSKENTQKLQELLLGNANLNSIDYSKQYKCNCADLSNNNIKGDEENR